MKIPKRTLQVVAVMCVFSYAQFGNVLGAIITLLIGQNSVDTAIQISVATIAILYSAIKINRHALLRNILFCVILSVLVFATKFLYPESYKYVQNDLPNIMMAVLAFIVISAINDVDIIFAGLKYAAYISMAYAIIIGLVISGLINLPGFTTSYMFYGYKSYLAAVVFTCLYEIEKNKKYLVFTGVTLLFVLMFGSRGPILCFLVFVFLYNVLIKGVRKKEFFSLLVIAIVVYTVLSDERVVYYISIQLKNIFGISSRSLQKLLDGTIWNNTGRDLLYGPAYGIIKENWLLGAGMYSDRALIYMASDDIKSVGYGHYVHNFFLEFLLDFGIPLTITFVVAYVGAMKKIFQSQEMRYVWCSVIMTTLWFGESLLSGSFWTMPFFWGSLAFLFVFWNKVRTLTPTQRCQPRTRGNQYGSSRTDYVNRYKE